MPCYMRHYCYIILFLYTIDVITLHVFMLVLYCIFQIVNMVICSCGVIRFTVDSMQMSVVGLVALLPQPTNQCHDHGYFHIKHYGTFQAFIYIRTSVIGHKGAVIRHSNHFFEWPTLYLLY